ncbi:MAG: geranylgeranyl reductase family protein [Euryarchaeota archaeon]|nr:geranylgeranyl reductase family protein [Euryarchaeota archaeon]
MAPTSGIDFDAIVVGGGPGGSSCAAFLSRHGLKTLLLDRATFPRDKTCGDAISGKSISVLSELGLTEYVEKEPHGLANGVTFSSPKGDLVTIPFPKRVNPETMKGQRRHEYLNPGYVSRRYVFDNIVFQNAKAQPNVTTYENFETTDLTWQDGKVTGVVGKHNGVEKRFTANVVVGADGALSVVAKKVGAFTEHDDHWIGALRIYYEGVTDVTENIEIHFVDSLLPGYFWIFPLENGMANVGSGMIQTDLKKARNGHKVNLKDETYKIIREHPMFKERFKNAKEVPGSFKGWKLPCGSEHRKLAGNGWVLVGDAAQLIDPFSGEGIGNALVSGHLAAETIASASKEKDFSEKRLQSYEANVWKTLDHELQASYRLQKIGRRTWLLNFVLRRAATRPKVREIISEMLADREKKAEFSSFWFYVKLLLA